MKTFKDHFKEDDIIFYLCRIRAKYAKQRNKKHLIHLLTRDEEFNYHKEDVEKLSDYEAQFQKDLNELFPSRRKWKDLGEKSRYKRGTKHKLSSVDKNIFSLMKTIKYYRKNCPAEEFVIKINSFIEDIQSTIIDPSYIISRPTIYPKPKERKRESELKETENNICRPIALFSLKDRLILSFTNKFLTQLFDVYFADCSLAFRAFRKIDEEKIIINHHTAIQEILKFKENHKHSPLWVAECDMKKFYDSVNHKIIVEHFDKLIAKAKEDNGNLDLSIPERIFYKYLECYTFNQNVIPLNSDFTYWEKYNIPKGEFGWVSKELKSLNFYQVIENERIGIPQGGALSGLIANIVLDYADRKVIENGLFYVRFCDDMILMHPDKNVCNVKVIEYEKALKDLYLVPHDFCKTSDLKAKNKPHKKGLPILSLYPFWKEKSKAPYKWDEVRNEGFPWIGFVGYELHYKGFIRVRKSSLQKELKKQKDVINQIRNAIKSEQRVSNGTIFESVIHRLIGMSIGRVDLWNYKDIENEMCWKNGFQELNSNKYAIKQLKELDRTRNRLYYKLIDDLVRAAEKKKRDDEDELDGKPFNRQIIDYNKPFSYYYQVAEKTKE